MNYSNYYLFRLWVGISIEWQEAYYQEVSQPLIPNALGGPLDRFSIFLPPQPRAAAFPFSQPCRLIEKIQINQVWRENRGWLVSKNLPRPFTIPSTTFHTTILNDSLISREEAGGEKCPFQALYTNFVREDRIIRKQERLWKVLISVALFCVHAKLTIVIASVDDRIVEFIFALLEQWIFFFNTWNNWKIRLTSFLGIFHIAICSIMNSEFLESFIQFCFDIEMNSIENYLILFLKIFKKKKEINGDMWMIKIIVDCWLRLL